MPRSFRVLLVALVAVLLVAAATRAGWRLDATPDRRFTTDPALQRILDGLTAPVAATIIWPKGESPQLDAVVERLGERLDGCARLAPRLEPRRIDSILERPLLEAFSKEFGEAAPGLYLTSAGRQPFRIALSTALLRRWQRELGGGLLSLQQAERPLVALLQGHGELRPGAAPGDACDRLLRRLELAGSEVRILDAPALDRLGRIPAGALLLMAGPTGPLGATTLRHITEHLRDGGSVLALLDYRTDPRLGGLFQDFGLEPGHDGRPALAYSVPASVGRDGSFHRLMLQGEDMIAAGGSGIAAVAAGSGRAISSPGTMPWAVAGGASAPALRRGEILLRLPAEQGWIGDPAPRQEPRQPLSGAIPLAVAVELAPRDDAVRGQGARIVVWGSRQAASDLVLGEERFANDQLLADMLGWLVRREASVPIPEAEHTAYRVEASENGLRLVMGLLVALVPCICLGGALLMWWDRRKTT